MRALHTNLVISTVSGITVVKTTGGAIIAANPNRESAIDAAINTSKHLWDMEFTRPQKPRRMKRDDMELAEYIPVW